jgi:hypothetical protein
MIMFTVEYGRNHMNTSFIQVKKNVLKKIIIWLLNVWTLSSISFPSPSQMIENVLFNVHR